MAKINLGGGKQITVSKELARRVANFKANPDILPNELFQCDDFMAEKRDIKSVVINDYEDNSQEQGANRKDDLADYYKAKEKEYEDTVRMRCRTPVAIKTNLTKNYELIYRSVAGNVPGAFIEEVKKRQADYFQANPKHPFAIIEIKDLLPSHRGTGIHIAGIIPSNLLKHVYSSMWTALDTAKRLHEV